jgi:NAD(P)-dependent dehydrogenase (short-subunit alcohol dehydrogenase family)
MGRLTGRTAIVTGGAKGIGVHYADALAAEGAQVMIGDIVDGAGVAKDICSRHGQGAVDSAVVDVSDEGAVKKFVPQTIQRFGKIDILINNAAVFANLEPHSVTDIDVKEWTA